MKILSILLLTVSFQAIGGPVCNSDSICVYSKMPLWGQGDPKFLAYLNKEKGLEIKSDPGWCGVFSTAMFLRAIALDNAFGSDMPNWVDGKINNYEFVTKVGDIIGVDWVNGGTYADVVFKNVQDQIYSQSYISKIDRMKTKRGLYTNVMYKDAAEFKREIRLMKTAGAISIARYSADGTVKRTETTCTGTGTAKVCKAQEVEYPNYKSEAANHALALNGYDGKYFKLYDPWGRIYNTEIIPTNVSIDNKYMAWRSIVKYVSGSKGFTDEIAGKTYLMYARRGWSQHREGAPMDWVEIVKPKTISDPRIKVLEKPKW